MGCTGKYEEGTHTETGLGLTFRFLRCLGKGAFGQVWEAFADGKLYAIKVYLENVVLKEVEQEVKHLKAVGKVCSSTAVCYIGVYKGPDSLPRVVTELVVGASLSSIGKRMTRDARQKIGETLLEQLVTGLGKLHKVGVSHQDIKSANIMYDTKNEKYRYIDFGLACISKNMGGACGDIGNLPNAPPELVGKSPKVDWDLTIAHDMWSLGCVIYRWYVTDHFKNKVFYYELDTQKLLENSERVLGKGKILNVLKRCFIADPEVRVKGYSQFLKLK